MKKNLKNTPVKLSILIIIVWFVLSSIFVFLTASITAIPILDMRIQNIGRLIGIIFLVIITLKYQLMNVTRLKNPGSWKFWLIVLFITVYLYIAGNYAYFGEVSFEWQRSINSVKVREILGTQILVGFMEELLFRGIIFSILIQKWGKGRKGLFCSAAVSSAFFASLHLLHLINAGSTQDILIVLANTIYTFLPGFWLALVVYLSGSIWPAIFLHAIGNAAILIPGLFNQMFDPVWSYIRLGVTDLILIVLLLGYLLLSTKPDLSD